jgi:predicted permease
MTWWARLVRRERVERQLDAELREHLERQVADYISEGMTEAAARRRARLEFGGLDQVKEQCRDVRGTRLIEETINDIGYACRVFFKNKAFSTMAVLTLSLAIGANVSVFALIDALLLRPLPVAHARDLISIRRVPFSESFSLPQVEEFASRQDLFASLTAVGTDAVNVGPPEAVEAVGAAWVTGHFYDTLGVIPPAGRLLRPDDDRLGAAPVAVITDGYWLRRFSRNRDILGQSVLIDGVPVTIVGVTPPEFLGVMIGEAADVTLPVYARAQVQPSSDRLEDDARWLRVLARPRDGMTLEQVEAQLAVLWSQRMKATVPANVAADVRARMLASTLEVVSGSAGSSDIRRRFRAPLLVAMGLVALVLLIACVNVANLLLARAAARRREVSLRLAIGASRGRILRQMMTESAVLAVAGAAGGLLIGSAGSRGLLSLIGAAEARPDSLGQVVLDLSFDWRVFAFTTAVVALTTLLFGAAPAMRAAATAPITPLTTRSVDARRRVAGALVTAQVALSLMVLVGAGLFTRTLYNLRTFERGFRHEGVLVAEIDARRAGYRDDALGVFNRDLLDFAERMPGVRVATVASVTPLRGGGISVPMLVNGLPAGDGEVYFNNVGPRYFEALGTAVVVGREFTLSDDRTGTPVAIVNETFARAFVQGQPLGQRVSVANSKIERQIVGVVADAVYETLRVAPPPTVYVPFFQTGGKQGGDIAVTLVVYVPQALESAATTIREYVQPKLGGRPPRIRTLTAQVDGSLSRERMMATITSIFGAVVLALAAIGIYGLLAYWVVRRTQEIGVRLALGADRVGVVRLVLGDAIRMVLVGAAIGIPAAWGLSLAISSLLFGLTPGDVRTLIGAVLVLLATGVIAAYVPARRATRVNPIVALRCE